MIRALETHLGRQAVIDRQPAFAADMQDTSAEIGKARQLLDWQPTTPPDEGFRLTAEWHTANADWLDPIEL